MAVKDWKTQESDIIADHYINKPKPIRIIVLGAGISGIAVAYKAKQLENVTYTIYDKNPDFGGTWIESNYPGVSCDVPAHCYTFTWAGYAKHVRPHEDQFIWLTTLIETLTGAGSTRVARR